MTNTFTRQNKKFVLCILVILLFQLFTKIEIHAESKNFKWERVSAVSSDEIKSLASNENIIVAVGQDGVILHSKDGRQWDRSNLPQAVELNSVMWANNMFLATGNNGTIVTSIDGLSWQIIACGLNRRDIYMTMNNIYDIAWDGHIFLTVGEGGNVFKSYDGFKWDFTNEPAIDYRNSSNLHINFNKIIHDGKRFITFSRKYELGPSLILTSQDGVNWSKANSQLRHDIVDLCFNGEEYIALTT